MKWKNVTEKTPGFWVLFAALALLVLFSFSFPGMPRFQASSRIPRDAQSDFALMAEAWNTIQKYYVDRPAVKPRDMTYGAIAGMVDALGDTGHSTFLTPDMIKEEDEYTEGRYKGIGAEVKMKDGHVVVVTPLDGSPAQKAGLRPGDIILAVDGRELTGLPLIKAVKLISGPVGTRVTLTILDPSTGRTKDVKLVRASITVDNVTWHALPGTQTAHVRIAGFSEDVSKDLSKTLEEVKGAGMKGMVLDLRNNPGGLLDEAVSTVSQFLKGGNALLEKNAEGKVSPIPVQPGGIATEIPLVGLVNVGTASAAEIVAGALQDTHRAVLVGEKTFGTGTVLEEFPLKDGSALLLAVQEWLTPDGNTIWHKGITPNRVVALPKGASPLFPEEEAGMTASQLLSSGDAQLLEAVKLLKEDLKTP